MPDSTSPIQRPKHLFSGDPKVVHGAVVEGVNIAGYAFGRASESLLWLLTDNRWLECGYSDVNTFMRTVDLSSLRPSMEQRRDFVRAVKAASPSVSARALAAAVGVTHPTVISDGKNLPPAQKATNETGVLPVSDGKNLPLVPEPLPPAGDKVAKDSGKRRDVPHVSQASGDPEWYTPAWLIDVARDVLGGEIDLDPASSETAQRTVQAGRWISVAEDALNPHTPWQPPRDHGTCWLNPPYDSVRVAAFADRLVTEFGRGTVGSALWLSNNATETRWAKLLLQHCSSFAVLHGRVKFYQSGTEHPAPLQGQMLVGFGVSMETLGAVLGDRAATWGVPWRQG